MSTNISSSLIGLSALTGTNGFASFGTQTIESAAVRAAKALFTTPDTTAPWDQPASSQPESSQLSAIKGLKTIIDKMNPGEAAGSNDVESSFVTYKALDRLRILADAASQPGMSDTQRASLQAAFAKGLSDLQSFLSTAPGGLLDLAFGDPTAGAQTVTLGMAQDIGKAVGTGVSSDHAKPLAGITGNEVITIGLSDGVRKTSVNVDLSTIASQPPSMDDIAKAFNDAIAAAPGGYDVKFSATMGANGKYALQMTSDGTQVSLGQAGVQDSVVVVASQTQFDTPLGAQVYRYGNPASGLKGQLLGAISATDPKAATSKPADDTSDDSDDEDASPTKATPLAGLTAQSSVTDAEGFTYVVGTTSGDMGTHLSDGADDLFLTKLDSEGKIVWQQTLGAQGEATGMALSLTPQGDVVVAGAVDGAVDGSRPGNSDMLVAKFGADGEKQFVSTIPSSGDDTASTVAVGADGSIYLGGKTGGANGGGYIAHMDAQGRMIQQRVIAGGNVTAFAVDGSGDLLALTREGGQSVLHRLDGQDLTSDLGSVSLGAADARALAVAADGSIAVVGATSVALPDNPTLPNPGGRDGFVTRLQADLSGASTTYVGGTGDDQIDSVAFSGTDIYVGGRTTSDLDGKRRGQMDGFVGRIDGATGTIASISQFGSGASVTDAVHVSVDAGGSNVLGALGLHQGTLNGAISSSLSAQTGLNAGDSFSFQMDGGAVHKISIDEGETLTSLQRKMQLAMGKAVTITVSRDDDGNGQIKLSLQQGHTLGLVAGPQGQDVLAKLGLDPARLHADAVRDPKAPAVQPGGSYGLSLNTSLNITSTTDAKAALSAITSAISMTQTAYRSLYWDDTKAAQVNGALGSGSAYQQSQLASYQAALQRLSAGAPTGMLF